MAEETRVMIEAPTMSDLQLLVDQWTELASDQRRHGSHLEADDNRDRIHESLARQIALGEILVARLDDRLVGFVSYTIEGSTFTRSETRGLIQNLYVVPSERGEGIGTRLLDAGERELTDQGADVLSLEVLSDNRAARRFYARHGYGPHRITLEKPTESDTS